MISSKTLPENDDSEAFDSILQICHRFQEVFCCSSSERHSGALPVKSAPNPNVAQNMANLQNTVTGLLFTVFRWSVCLYHVSNVLESLLRNFYLTKLRLFENYSHTPQNHRSLLLLWCLPSERHFEALTVKLSLNPIMTQKMVDLQNSITRLLIIVFI